MSQYDFAKFFGSEFASNLPSTSQFLPFDVKSLLETQRKNLQAFSEAIQVVVESSQTIAQSQAEILSQFAADNSSLIQEIANEGTPEEKIAKHADLIKKNYEKSVANWKEISDIASKSGKEATDIINKRVSASLTEIKSSLGKKGPSANTNSARKKAA
ncbi:MAG TPA: phasin family protein [Patescibacteria group bacterium]|nr:phasin family protein [Patescibacteria group bacterium]